MKDGFLTGFQHEGSDTTKIRLGLPLERCGVLYARVALGAAFLSAVADRFGLWGKYGGWGNFSNFEQYTAQVNSFMPAFIIPFLAWAATAAELSLGIALIVGIWTYWVARGAAALLFLFGTAMAISFGIKSPLDYSVFSASAAAFLLSLCQAKRDQMRKMDAGDANDKSRQPHVRKMRDRVQQLEGVRVPCEPRPGSPQRIMEDLDNQIQLPWTTMVCSANLGSKELRQQDMLDQTYDAAVEYCSEAGLLGENV